MEYFWMELYAPEFFTFCLISCYCYLVGRSNDFKVFGDSCNGISVAHPHLRVFADAFQQRILVVELGQMCTSVFTCVGRFNFTSVGIRHKLCAVADTQDRIFAANIGQINFEGLFIVYRERASGKDDTDNRRIIVGKLVVGNNLAIHVQFAYAAADELRGL